MNKKVNIHLADNNNGEQNLEAIYINGELLKQDYTLNMDNILYSLIGYTIESVTSDSYNNEQMDKMNNTFPMYQKDLVSNEL